MTHLLSIIDHTAMLKQLQWVLGDVEQVGVLSLTPPISPVRAVRVKIVEQTGLTVPVREPLLSSSCGAVSTRVHTCTQRVIFGMA